VTLCPAIRAEVLADLGLMDHGEDREHRYRCAKCGKGRDVPAGLTISGVKGGVCWDCFMKGGQSFGKLKRAKAKPKRPEGKGLGALI
jgi:hypothetical protein